VTVSHESPSHGATVERASLENVAHPKYAVCEKRVQGDEKQRPGIEGTGSLTTLLLRRHEKKPRKDPTAIAYEYYDRRCRHKAYGKDGPYAYSKPTATSQGYTDRNLLFFVSGIVLPQMVKPRSRWHFRSGLLPQ
jgi:hypothetical protein